ncbi:MAG: CDP-diacylglycerol--glycerol-3-phosphate 3-phosphatidyltransferase [Acholeplasmatales bacterium]|nr:MAG: CDP-diacylglycerol--glycerol-3-phosphate 3-phosphatidyltransferase [Acholeplasmatales bacterium]
MNLPNKLTMLRVLLIPIMTALYYLNPDRLALNVYSYTIGGLFVLGSFTDFLDGYIARKNGLITTFGKFLDPLADKLFVMFALLYFLNIKVIPMWVVLIILSREFLVTGIRLVAMGEGKVVVAGTLGKYKTAATMLALVLLFFRFHPTIELTGFVLLYVGLVLTVLSGAEYYHHNKEALTRTL